MPLTFILLVPLAILLGWLASVFLRTGTPRELLLLVAVSLAGALIGAFLITPPFAGRLALNGFSLPGLLFSLSGSILLLAIAGALLRMARRRRKLPSGA